MKSTASGRNQRQLVAAWLCRAAGAATQPAIVALAALLALPGSSSTAAGRVEPPLAPGQAYHYRPTLAMSESLKPFSDDITPGNAQFPDERLTGELISRLAELSERLKTGRDRAHAADFLLATSFRGGPLRPPEERPVTRQPSLEIDRASGAAAGPSLDARAFALDFGRLIEDFRSISVAEFLITAVDFQQDKLGATTQIRYDIVGPGRDAWRVQRVGQWQVRWSREASGWLVREWTAAEQLRNRARAPVFSEVTTAAFGGNASFKRQLSTGFDALTVTMDAVLARESNGHHGVAVADVDGDKLDDLYIAQPYGIPDRLYRARGDGTFEDFTEKAGLSGLDGTTDVLFFDVNNDGHQDLVINAGAGPTLFLNDGNGHFTRKPDAFHFKRPLQGAPMSMAVADYDRDGFLDLYLCVYSYQYGAGEVKAGTPTPYYDALNGPPNVLFRNDGHANFIDVTEEAGLNVNNDRYSFSAAWADYDGDGWPDLVVTNDFGRKNLYHNLGLRNGKVTFEDVAAKAGVEDYAAGMSVSWFDYDNDGRLDIYAGQMWSANGLRVTASPAFMPEASDRVHAIYRHHAQGNSVLRNKGDGTFEDVSLPARANMGRWSWSTGALDFDCDGWEDVYAVTGMVTRQSSKEDLDWMFWGGVVARSPMTEASGTPYDQAWRAMNRFMTEHSVAGHQRNVFLRNDGHGAFDDISGAVGLDLDEDGRSFAVLDFNRDGAPDIVSLAPRSAPQLRLFRNDFKPRGATIAVRLVGTKSNRDAVGALVTAQTDQLRVTKMVSAGSGFLSQHSKELILGLGSSQRISQLVVAWPSGARQVFADVPLNHRLLIEEGSPLKSEPYAALPPLPVDSMPPTPAPPPPATWLYEPFPAPDFALKDLRGEERTLAALRGRPAVVLLWAAQAPPSRVALQALAKGASALEHAGIAALALAFDPPADAEKVRSAASGVTTLPVLVASDEVATTWDMLHRNLFMNHPDIALPTALLLDSNGEIVRIYRGLVDVPQILLDAAHIDAPDAERLARARPFEGVSDSDPGGRDLVPYARDLLDQGLESPATATLELAVQGNPTASIFYRLGSLLEKAGQTAKARAAYERALILKPDLAEAHNDLGTLMAQSGDLPAALRHFRAALAASPNAADVLTNLGYALLLAGQATEARQHYEKALAIQPDLPEALNNLGLILGRAGELDKAENHFRRALEKQPTYAEAANNLAVALASRGQADEAIRLLEAFIDKTPGAESSYVMLAKVYLSVRRREDGLAVIERLLKRNPGHPAALELRRAIR
jgi:Tfp pilus assembly protein PilF/peroxiredoxin